LRGIGKRYSVADLGYFSKGCEFPMLVSLYTFGTISSVLLPTITSYKSDMGAVKHIIRRLAVFFHWITLQHKLAGAGLRRCNGSAYMGYFLGA